MVKAPYLSEDGTYYLQTNGIANEIADKEITADRVVIADDSKIPHLDALYNLFCRRGDL